MNSSAKRLNEMNRLADMGHFPAVVNAGATVNVLVTIVVTWFVVPRFPQAFAPVIWVALVLAVNLLPVVVLRMGMGPDTQFPTLAEMDFVKDQHKFSDWVYVAASANMAFWVLVGAHSDGAGGVVVGGAGGDVFAGVGAGAGLGGRIGFAAVMGARTKGGGEDGGCGEFLESAGEGSGQRVSEGEVERAGAEVRWWRDGARVRASAWGKRDLARCVGFGFWLRIDEHFFLQLKFGVDEV